MAEIRYRPLVGITMGDPAGVGPEIIIKGLAHREVYDLCRPVVIGDVNRLEEALEFVKIPISINGMSEPFQGQCVPDIIDVVDLELTPAGLPFGQLSAAAGEAAFGYIQKSAELALLHELDAIVTAPISKQALHLAGHHYPGHTELYAELTGADEVSLMLATGRLHVIHVTAHVGLVDAINRIDDSLVERTIVRGRQILIDIGLADPRIGVCGINPHAGEEGLFGLGEERTKILPAIERCRARGWNVEGPLPADALFYRAGKQDFDLVVAMYHDQGHAPVKLLGIEDGVNITVGLPVVRTSVDHGTAFDIAGTGRADERSLLRAIEWAVKLADARRLGAKT